MKSKKIPFVLLFFLMGLLCFSNDFQNISVSLEPIFGYQYGTLYEYVYVKAAGGGTRLLSELDWKNAVLYAGGRLAISYKIFSFFAGGGAYFPMHSGTIEDSDWLNENDYSMKTNFSISENSLKSGGFFSTGFYASFPVASILNVSPTISVDVQKKHFSGKNGYGWYGDSGNSLNGENVPWNDENAKYYDTGRLQGIDYDRLDFTAWTGFSIDIIPMRFLRLSFAFDVTLFSLVDSLDTHFGSSFNSYYYDTCYDFFSYGRAYFDVAFQVSTYIVLKASASYLFPFFKKLRGTTYSSSRESSGYVVSSSSVPAASSKVWNWSISVVFKDLQKR